MRKLGITFGLAIAFVLVSAVDEMQANQEVKVTFVSR